MSDQTDQRIDAASALNAAKRYLIYWLIWLGLFLTLSYALFELLENPNRFYDLIGPLALFPFFWIVIRFSQAIIEYRTGRPAEEFSGVARFAVVLVLFLVMVVPVFWIVGWIAG